MLILVIHRNLNRLKARSIHRLRHFNVGFMKTCDGKVRLKSNVNYSCLDYVPASYFDGCNVDYQTH